MKAAADESWQELTTANDDIDAQLLVGLLEEAGIDTRVVKNRSGYGDYLYGGSNPWAPVTIHVHPAALENARRVLADARAAGRGAETPAEERTPTRSGPSWPTVIAIAIVGLMVLTFLLEQRDLFL